MFKLRVLATFTYIAAVFPQDVIAEKRGLRGGQLVESHGEEKRKLSRDAIGMKSVKDEYYDLFDEEDFDSYYHDDPEESYYYEEPEYYDVSDSEEPANNVERYWRVRIRP